MSSTPTPLTSLRLDLVNKTTIASGLKILAGCFCIWYALTIIYNVFFHPLARIPGPFLARFSRSWFIWRTWQGRLNKVTLDLHKRHGSVVRLAPNEISVMSSDAIKTVHGQNTDFTKGPWYNVSKVFHDPEALQMLVEFDDKKRRFQRRLFGPAYTTAALSQHEENVDKLLSVLNDKIKEDPKRVHDLEEFFHMYACDATAEMLFSKRPQFVDEGNDYGSARMDWRKWWIRSIVGQSQIATSIYMFLRRHTPMAKYIEFDKFTLWSFANVASRMSGAEPEKSPYGEDHSDVARDLVLLQQKKTGWMPRWTNELLIASCLAGHSTITATALGFAANLNTHPEIQARIVKELETARAQGKLSTPPKFTELTDMPYFEASIKESMRLLPPAWVGIPRATPSGGAVIDGYHIPAGTTVDVNLYVMHRNPEVFGADADEYKPERWLTKDDERRKLMQHNFLSFGGRSRPCPGQYLAELIMFKLFATLFLNFEWDIQWDRSKEPIASVITNIPGLTATFKSK